MHTSYINFSVHLPYYLWLKHSAATTVPPTPKHRITDSSNGAAVHHRNLASRRLNSSVRESAGASPDALTKGNVCGWVEYCDDARRLDAPNLRNWLLVEWEGSGGVGVSGWGLICRRRQESLVVSYATRPLCVWRETVASVTWHK
jgi:hypothetical protein